MLSSQETNLTSKNWIVHKGTLSHFFGSLENAENDDAECNSNARENSNVEDPEVAINKEAERPQQAGRPPDKRQF